MVFIIRNVQVFNLSLTPGLDVPSISSFSETSFVFCRHVLITSLFLRVWIIVCLNSILKSCCSRGRYPLLWRLGFKSFNFWTSFPRVWSSLSFLPKEGDLKLTFLSENSLFAWMQLQRKWITLMSIQDNMRETNKCKRYTLSFSALSIDQLSTED